MALWLVRAGKNGEREDLALEKSLAVIGWEELPDLRPVETRDELAVLMRDAYTDANPNTISNWVAQVWAFRNTIQKNDHVILPLKTRAAVAVGVFTGDYEYRTDLEEDVRHVRPVKWLKTDLPRSAFDQDLLYSLGAYLTVCRIQRNNAEVRILELTKKKPTSSSANPPTVVDDSASDAIAPPDLIQLARDQIRSFVGQKFKTRDLERLVAALLEAQGYRVQRAPGGPDGGADIIAGGGPMGFDPPRLCVQVKSGNKPSDVRVIRELQGVASQFKADHGMLVSWSGFTREAQKEARQLFFQIRLWDSDDILANLVENYDRLPEDLRTEIPLQRIWTLVPPVEEEG